MPGKLTIHEKFLEFIPEYEHCLAMFWGPLVLPHTRIIVVHGTKEVFRVATKAVVLDPKHHFKIVKHSKWEGKFHKTNNERTALIKFEPEDIDVAEFKGASIRTESGIWGKVNKVIKRKGIATCEFDKGICDSDIVIMPVLCQIDLHSKLMPTKNRYPYGSQGL